MLQNRVDHIYDEFVQRVALCRKLTTNRVDEIAQGRGLVWRDWRAVRRRNEGRRAELEFHFLDSHFPDLRDCGLPCVIRSPSNPLFNHDNCFQKPPTASRSLPEFRMRTNRHQAGNRRR